MPKAEEIGEQYVENFFEQNMRTHLKVDPSGAVARNVHVELEDEKPRQKQQERCLPGKGIVGLKIHHSGGSLDILQVAANGVVKVSSCR